MSERPGVIEILTHAGADGDAPEGSQAWSLAQAAAAVAELMDKVDSALTLGWNDTAARELRAALSQCQGGQT